MGKLIAGAHDKTGKSVFGIESGLNRATLEIERVCCCPVFIRLAVAVGRLFGTFLFAFLGHAEVHQRFFLHENFKRRFYQVLIIFFQTFLEKIAGHGNDEGIVF